MVRNCSAEAGPLGARARLLLQLRDVYAVDGSVVHGRVFDFFAASPITRLHRGRGDGKVCSRGSRRSRQPSRATLLDVINNGLWQAQFPGRGQVLYLVAFFNHAQSHDSSAVLEDNRVRRRPRAYREHRGAQKKDAISAPGNQSSHLFMLIHSRHLRLATLFLHAESDYIQV